MRRRSLLVDAQFHHDEQDFAVAVAAAERLPFGRVSGAGSIA